MPTVKDVLQKYHEGQNIFRRESVACLVARIEQLEKYIASQQSVHRMVDVPCEKHGVEYCVECYPAVVVNFKRR